MRLIVTSGALGIPEPLIPYIQGEMGWVWDGLTVIVTSGAVPPTVTVALAGEDVPPLPVQVSV